MEIHDIATGSARPLMQMRISTTGEMNAFTPQNPPEAEVALPDSFNSDECKALVNQLSPLLDDYHRLIIVPRPGMDTRLALTAWTYIDKLDTFDETRVREFISAHENQGPEKTVE